MRRGCGLVYPAPAFKRGKTPWCCPRGRQASRSLTLVGYAGAPAAWSVAPRRRGPARRHPARESWDATNGYEQRLTLAYDGSAGPSLSLQCGGKTLKLNLQVQGAAGEVLPAERERIVVLPAGSASAGSDWEPQPGLGTSGRAMRARLDLPAGAPAAPNAAATLTYRFQTSSEGGATLRFVAVPVHALTSDNRLRIAVQLDDGPPRTLDYTTVGRSDEWKQNVLSNMAVRTTTVARLAPGPHTLRVFALDPGVVLDRVDVVMDGAPDYYGMPPSD